MYDATLGRPSFLTVRLGKAEAVFWRGLVAMALFILVFEAIYLVEKRVFDLRSSQRFAIDCIEAPMRYFTFAHFAVAATFMLSARSNKTTRRRLMLAGLLAVGGVLCAIVHYLIGNALLWDMHHGTQLNMQIQMLVLTYFLLHELRDEAFFYRAMGDCPKHVSATDCERLCNGLAVRLPLLLVVGYLWPRQILSTSLASVPIFADLPLESRFVIAFLPLSVCAVFIHRFLRSEATRIGTDVIGLISTHAPLFRVIGGVFGTIAVGVLFFQRASLLVLLHVVVWYVFAIHWKKTHEPAEPPAGWWDWMRSTASGLRFLHLSLFAFFLLWGLLYVYGFGQQGWGWTVIAPSTFVYWTILHITVSLMPR